MIFYPNFRISNNLHTLTFLINGHARLLNFGVFSTLDALIRASPFINYIEKFHPPLLLGSFKKVRDTFCALITRKKDTKVHCLL